MNDKAIIQQVLESKYLDKQELQQKLKDQGRKVAAEYLRQRISGKGSILTDAQGSYIGYWDAISSDDPDQILVFIKMERSTLSYDQIIASIGGMQDVSTELKYLFLETGPYRVKISRWDRGHSYSLDKEDIMRLAAFFAEKGFRTFTKKPSGNNFIRGDPRYFRLFLKLPLGYCNVHDIDGYLLPRNVCEEIKKSLIGQGITATIETINYRSNLFPMPPKYGNTATKSGTAKQNTLPAKNKKQEKADPPMQTLLTTYKQISVFDLL